MNGKAATSYSLVDRMLDLTKRRETWFSLEFFPPKTAAGTEDLISVFDYFLPSNPLFYSVVWKNSTTDTDKRPENAEANEPSMKLANVMVNFCGLDTLLHITCYGQTKESVRKRLQLAKSIGIRNVLAIYGDPTFGVPGLEEENGDFKNAAELVHFIRKEFKDEDSFGIGVAGYPSGHPTTTYDQSIAILKDKVEAGADFVVSQVFFDANTFIKFVRDCRATGIRCPIIANIFPISSYINFDSIIRLSRIPIPDEVNETISTIQHNDDQIQSYGIELCVKACQQIIESGLANGFHFTTLNRRTASGEILKRLGLWVSKPSRLMPWRQSAKAVRYAQESVRPIFWSARVNNYLHKTSSWEQFPNGRWTNPNLASFCDVSDHYLAFHHWNIPRQSLLDQWGHVLNSEQDVWAVFKGFLSNSKNPSTGTLIELFPWCDDGKVADETACIIDQLINLNSRGILTINSQPNVNGVPSNHPVHGWGPSDGYVYQKAYLEFFIPTKIVGSLLTILRQYPRVSFHIVNKHEHDDITNHEDSHTIAVTWGVFPGREVLQPTVVDSMSFRIWKNEAYAIWLKRWGVLYERDSPSYKLLEHITETYSLVNLVDNDFPKENCLFELLDRVLEYENREYSVQQIFAV